MIPMSIFYGCFAHETSRKTVLQEAATRSFCGTISNKTITERSTLQITMVYFYVRT